MRHTGVHISPGSHECGESGRAIARVQAFSFVAFQGAGLVYVFFLAGGANQSFDEPVSYQDRYNQHSCIPSIPSPFTAGFQGALVADDVTTVLVPE